ncbi:MAG TPA: peptidylprolyl isomerase [Gemmatimonadales bacterium]|nr:peptidylprolyl isomerase [Gemmatimonadales bacterium]
MSQAKTGDTVRVHYQGSLSDGTVFDSSRGRDPLEVTLGSSQLIPGFENALLGMQTGEERRVTIPADEAYGQRREELILEVPRDKFPPTIEPEIGKQLRMTQEGHDFVVVVQDIRDDLVMLDANHPLAGKELTFELELVEVR